VLDGVDESDGLEVLGVELLELGGGFVVERVFDVFESLSVFGFGRVSVKSPLRVELSEPGRALLVVVPRVVLFVSLSVSVSRLRFVRSPVRALRESLLELRLPAALFELDARLPISGEVVADSVELDDELDDALLRSVLLRPRWLGRSHCARSAPVS
jgi:hypothetical protein